MQNLGRLAIKVKTLELSDSLGKAAEAVRASAIGAAPVVQFGQVIALVTSDILGEFLLTPGVAGRARELQVGELPLEGVIAIPYGLSPSEALAFFRANELERAPVVDATGQYLGMITTAELVSAVCGRVRPPLVGGMATPFGVYLTGGGVRGGVGDFALVTTGMYLGVLQLAAFLLTDWLLSPGVTHLLPAPDRWVARLNSPEVQFAILMVVFGVLFRLSWLITGFHAAEHQVVHTIEAGDELVPEVVRTKPRVHPRCGTNLVTAVLIMSTFWMLGRRLPADAANDWLVPVAMFVTWLLWRRVGGWIQQNVTTRPPNLRHLQSGIFAAEQLMDRYQVGPPIVQRPMQRIWNMGLLQVLSGAWLVVGAVELLAWLAPGLVPPGLRLQ